MTCFIVQMSDLHLRTPGQLAAGGLDTAPYLRRAVQTVLRLPQPPAAVVITGDLTDFGSAAEYALLAELIAPLHMPVYLLAGNHDDSAQLRRSFAHQPWMAGEGPLDYAVAVGPLRLLVLDTSVPGQEHGLLRPAQLDWLAQEMARHRHQSVIVAMHHPPFQTLIPGMDRIGLAEGGPALERLLAGYPNVERVICGHVHRPVQRRFGGTIASIAPATAHQIYLDFDPATPLSWTLEPPAFHIHALAGDGSIVTHLMPVGEFDGPHAYED